MATVSTTKKDSTSTPDVTGSKKGPRKGVARGRLTKPLFPSNQERMGAITNKAREIAARNGGYVNAEMIYRELHDHPVYQEMVFGPEGVAPAKAYDLLTIAKVKSWYNEAIQLIEKVYNGTTKEYEPKIHPVTGEPVNAHVDYEQGGPKKGALPVLATMRGGKAFVDTDEL